MIETQGHNTSLHEQIPVNASAVSTHEIYREVLKDYPDVLDVKQVSQILGVSSKTVYRLLRNGNIESLKVGREFRIPKIIIMRYIKLLNG